MKSYGEYTTDWLRRTMADRERGLAIHSTPNAYVIAAMFRDNGAECPFSEHFSINAAESLDFMSETLEQYTPQQRELFLEGIETELEAVSLFVEKLRARTGTKKAPCTAQEE